MPVCAFGWFLDLSGMEISLVQGGTLMGIYFKIGKQKQVLDQCADKSVFELVTVTHT